MTSDPRHLRIFISSPGDVSEERGIAAKVIEDMNFQDEFKGEFTLEPLRWDDPRVTLPMPANVNAQKSVDRYLIKPSECDLVIVIFWSRMGSEVTMDGEPYNSGTHYELSDALAAGVETWVYRRTADPQIDVRQPDAPQRLAQWQKVETFFADFKTPDGDPVFENRYEEPEDFRELFTQQLESHLRYLRKHPDATTTTTEKPPGAPPQLWQGSPFPGLKPFNDQQTAIYFGRGRETDRLVQRLREARFVAVIGASGSGKSSLVGAGLLPRLGDDALPDSSGWLLPAWNNDLRQWVYLRFTPGEIGDNPFAALAARFGPLVGEVPRQLATTLHEDPASILNWGAAALTAHPPDAELLLFIDQFEELFTLNQPAYLESFAALLVAINTSHRLRAVITLRADFYHRCLALPTLADLLQRGTFPLAAPTLSALHEMIVRPAERAALDFEDGLVSQILDDMGHDRGALALMAYALDELYKIAESRRVGARHASSAPESLQITFADYEAIGRVAGAIGKRAEGVFAKLSGAEDAKTALLHAIFHELVEVDERGVATRRRAIIDPNALDADERNMVTAFTDARLLITDRQDGAVTLEVAHEAILRNWERLADWIEATQDDLRLIRSLEREARWWDERDRPDFMLPNTAKINEFQDACRNLGVEYDPDNTEARVMLDFTEPEQKRLWRELHDINTSPARRSVIGETLHNLGDDRFGIGVRDDGTPEIDWCPVPGGQIEIKGQTFTVAPFYIARYLVTYSQFEAFLGAEDGFGRDEWWAELTEEYHKQSMANQRQKYDNYPRDNVSWYQAVAFTRWLTARLRGETLPHPEDEQQPPLVIGGNVEVRLPAEWEWIHAATGGNPAQGYPWGPKFDARRVNGSEGGIGRTSAVGVFPHGAADCGALDMAGNVWEWCLNDSGDLKIDFVSTNYKRLMGGAYHSRGAGASSRSFNPRLGAGYGGLRVAVGVRLPSQ